MILFVLAVNVPVAALESLCFSLIMYPMSGLQGDVFVSGHFWFFYLTLYAMNLASKAFSIFIAGVSGTPQAAMGLAPIFIVLFILVGGIHIYIHQHSHEYHLSFLFNGFIGLLFMCIVRRFHGTLQIYPNWMAMVILVIIHYLYH
jgi:hypothetical protein